jgi:predicted O-methyltransferase YrrM
MKKKVDLKTERMNGFGPFIMENYEVNYLFGLNDLCEKYVKDNFIILELGSNDGVSTSLFSYFANKVISVDLKKTESMESVLLENNNIIFYNTSFENFYKNDKDNQYDLIYIDGAHDYESVDKDISMFKPKVKKGGFISGHDYYSPDVKNAVKKHFDEKNIILFSDSSWLVEIN